MRFLRRGGISRAVEDFGLESLNRGHLAQWLKIYHYFFTESDLISRTMSDSPPPIGASDTRASFSFWQGL